MQRQMVQPALSRQIGGGVDGRGMLQPGGRSADLPTPVGEMARDEVGRVQRMIAAAQGNINRAAAQIRQRFAEMQLQAQRGVFVADAP